MKNKLVQTKILTIIAILICATFMTTLNNTNTVEAQTTLPAGTIATNVQEGASVPGELDDDITPSVTVDTTAYLSVSPSLVGVGQSILINVWITPALHVSRYFSNYTITITDPDGNEDVINLDSYRADTTAYLVYEVDQTGNWTVQFDFPGGYFPAGNYTEYSGAVMLYGAGNTYVSFTEDCYYEPSSTAETTISVQDDIVSSWVDTSSSPNDYWTRPVSPEHREWATYIGDYPWHGPAADEDNWAEDTNTYWSASYRYTPYVQAPESAHILWRQQTAISGLVGGDSGTDSYYTNGGNPSIIYQGRCYQSYTKPGVGTTSTTYWKCYDLRTGELYWEYALSTAPTVIEYANGTSEVPGAGSQASSATLDYFSTSGYFLKFNPWTGAVSYNFSTPAFTSNTYYMNGYVLSLQKIGSSYYLINWTTLGTSTTFANRVISNVTYPWSTLGTTIDYEAGIAAYISPITPSALGSWYGTTVRAASIETGEALWNITLDETVYSTTCCVADHGMVAVLVMGGYYLAFDLETGTQVWQSEAMDYPWAEPAFGAYSVQSAYGMIYRESYNGIYAFDWDTGDIAWYFEAEATPFETAYTDENGTSVYSFNAGALIADGKLYTYTTEHTATEPITRGWKIYCVDAYTGEGIWNCTGAMVPGAVADGYLTAANNYDGYMYVFGKGESATTLSAPQTAVTLGDSVMLTGTVMDLSGEEGAACVSEDSMSTYMEYLYMQKDIPSDTTVTGVDVSIDAIDPNGNSVHIATVKSDMSGSFSYFWAPEISGEYTITATFVGSNSYGSSYAETALGVVEAAETVAPTTTDISFDTVNNTLLPAILGGVIAIIVAVAIVGFLVLKKK
ncbi:MAG: PQQ-binding-like beta-propeller repeat protein [Candidatus Bathyarchaeia archaeon]